MPFYPVVPPDVISGCAEDAALGLPGQPGVVAVRAADLASPARQGLGRDGRTAPRLPNAVVIRFPFGSRVVPATAWLPLASRTLPLLASENPAGSVASVGSVPL